MNNPNTTLKKICDDFYVLYGDFEKERAKVIQFACEKLVGLLESLKPHHYCNLYDERDYALWIYLGYEHHFGIRYCGRFVNVIKVLKDVNKAAIQRISLGYISSEDELDDFGRFPDDSYYGEKAEERCDFINIAYDWENFRHLLESLKPFFSSVSSSYGEMLKEIQSAAKQMSKLDDKISELNEDLYFYLIDVIEKVKRYDKNNRKHFIMLPDNLSIRYKGRFHNCIVMDNYSHSLGYIQFRQFVAEEGYNNDPYTVGDDFDRYLPCDYKLLHEVSLNSYHNGYLQFGRALQDLIFLCGENLERLSECQYLKQDEVVFTKSSLT